MSSEEFTIEENFSSEDAVREILTREAGLKFMVPRSFELPTEYNLHALEGIGITTERLQEVINLFTTYLKSFVVYNEEYTIDKDKERVEKRKELVEKLGRIAQNLLYQNKIRHSRISAVSGVFDTWVARSESPRFQNWPHAAEIKKLRDAFPVKMFGPYDGLPLSEKLDIVEKIEDILVEFLRSIGSKEAEIKRAVAAS